jgi:hypothetical protein
VLTGSLVYNTSSNIDGTPHHEVLVEYDPDEADGLLHVVMEVSLDDNNTADDSTAWVQVGEIASAGGTLTFTARELQMASAGAGTKSYAHWSEEAVGYKIRVGARETFTAGGSDFGNARIVLFSRSAT